MCHDSCRNSLSSDKSMLTGSLHTDIVNGEGKFSAFKTNGENITGWHKFVISFPDSELDDVFVNVNVRECRIGERIDDAGGLYCAPCETKRFNFAIESRSCEICPEHTVCNGQSILAQKGYWLPHPCHQEPKKCISTEACNGNGEDFKEVRRILDAVFSDENKDQCNRSAGVCGENAKVCIEDCVFRNFCEASNLDGCPLIQRRVTQECKNSELCNETMEDVLFWIIQRHWEALEATETICQTNSKSECLTEDWKTICDLGDEDLRIAFLNHTFFDTKNSSLSSIDNCPLFKSDEEMNVQCSQVRSQ